MNNLSLTISVRTWSRDSHGLYDYECSSTKNIIFKKVKNDQIIIRKKNEVRLLEEISYKEEQDEESLGKVCVDALSKCLINYKIDIYS